ncbi:MAG: Dabb family protein [Devosia sp.]
MIRHTVAFNLKHAGGSAGERAFLADARTELTAVPSVTDFEQTRQISQKNPYRFNFAMSFADQAAYDAYNVHPRHVAFVRDRWDKEVAEFLEADFVAL